MDSLIIQVDKLDDIREQFDRTLSKAFLVDVLAEARGFTVAAPAEFTAFLSKVGERDVLVEGETTLAVESACRRCLKPVQSEFPVDFILNLVARAAAGKGRHGKDHGKDGKKKKEDTGEDPRSDSFEEGPDEETFDGERVDLGPILREQLLLGLPSIEPLCREDCKGLCATCGQELNEADCGHSAKGFDPRWSALRDLKV